MGGRLARTVGLWIASLPVRQQVVVMATLTWVTGGVVFAVVLLAVIRVVGLVLGWSIPLWYALLGSGLFMTAWSWIERDRFVPIEQSGDA